MYLTIKLLLIFLLSILFFCEAEESSTEQTCVNDYLLLSKSLKSEIFAEKIGNEWKVERGINNKVFGKIKKNFIIKKEKMSKYMGEENANKCFELNKDLVKQYNEKLLNKVKNFSFKESIKAKKPIIIENSFSLKDYLNKSKNKYFILSESVQNDLDKMSFCIVDKIYEFYKKLNEGKNLLTIFFQSENIKNMNDAIFDKYKITSENEVYIAKLEFNPMFVGKISVKKGWKLEECGKFIKQKKYSKEFFSMISPSQLFFEKFPKDSSFTGFEINGENGNEIKNMYCSICEEKLVIFKNGEYKEITKTDCNHNFHKKCLQNWLRENHLKIEVYPIHVITGSCQICQKKVLYDLRNQKIIPNCVSFVTDIEINDQFKEKNKDEECFCLEKLIEQENEGKYKEIQQIPKCKHNFHKECLQEWLKTKDVEDDGGKHLIKDGCPMCRAEVLCKNEKKEIIPIN